MSKAEEKLVKHTLNLYEGDYRKIQTLYPDIGAGAVIRRIVRNFIKRVELGIPDPDITEEVKL